MLWAALAYAAGIIGGTYLLRAPSCWAFAAVAFLAASLYFIRRRERVAAVLALGTIFFVGAVPVQVGRSSNGLDRGIQAFAYGPEIQITAHVIREGKLKPASPGEVAQSLGRPDGRGLDEYGPANPDSLGRARWAVWRSR